MDVETKAVACPVKETLHSSFHYTRVEAFALEVIHNRGMNVISAGTVANTPECDILAFLNAMVRMLQPIRRTSPNDGSCDVAEISRFLRSRENIHDDRCVCPDGTTALIVRIHTLIA